ncbi:l-asparaginase [Culex quinquefasciatus]|uniref:L-asparaginase n=1 Tax=Culex quinquefasciatus TaxID=7176 RepID=B0W7T8_CULQU|nr:probable isoaspartyl peptidase/L-asparaginase GA20639 [Culex quinquefasciatus]EDS38232.1 l-asparaginase [Culex quinquefasciatus]|eukprot:XP_001844772.1 l-asparaginase [Culex quinquefasciatus]
MYIYPAAVLIALVHLQNHFSEAFEPIVLVHGGAGTIGEDRIPGKYRGSKLAARVGYRVLLNNGSVLDAVEEAVRIMEGDSNFNAGYGSVLNQDGVVEMDASIMDGATMMAGCVAGVQDVLHPITLARRVMERTRHNFLVGEGLLNFTRQQGIEILSPPGQLVTQRSKDALEAWKENSGAFGIGEGGTVGAVAIDREGNIAAATSTGGLTGKHPGRVGDSPILGAGTYADNLLGGISVTGDGDIIMKVSLAYDIVKRMEYLGVGIEEAAEDALTAMSNRLDGTAGIVALDAAGNIGIAFNSEQMSWAFQRGNVVAYGVRKGEHLEEIVSEEQDLEEALLLAEHMFHGLN